MSTLRDDLENRRNAVGQVAVGGAMVGGASLADAALNERLARSGRKGLLRSTGRTVRNAAERVVEGKPGQHTPPRTPGLGKVHVGHAAGKLGVRGVQLAGLPLMAYGAKNALSAKPEKTRRVSVKRDVLEGTVRHATFQDQLERGRDTVGKSLLPGGVWKPATELSPGARAVVRRGGVHAQAHGMSNKDRAFKNTMATLEKDPAVRAVAAAAKRKPNRVERVKGRLLPVHKVPSMGQMVAAVTPGPGKGPQRATGFIMAEGKTGLPKKLTKPFAEHEKVHATVRKPRSAAARRFVDPRKGLAEEARADQAMGPAKAASAYRSAALPASEVAREMRSLPGAKGFSGVDLFNYARDSRNQARGYLAAHPNFVRGNIDENLKGYRDTDAKLRGVRKADTELEEKIGRRKRLGSALSYASGTMGLTALALRSPGGAKLALKAGRKAYPKVMRFGPDTIRRSQIPAQPKGKPWDAQGGVRAVVEPAAERAAGVLRRVANKEPAATRASNTLGVAAIGTGSANSFNWASQQRLETKQDARNKARVEQAIATKSYLGSGVWKPAAKLSALERAAVRRDPFGPLPGRTSADNDLHHEVTSRIKEARAAVAGAPKKKIAVAHNRRGNKVAVVAGLDDPIAAALTTPLPPRPGVGQRRSSSVIQVADNLGGHKREPLMRHEMTHTEHRKPMSAYVRHSGSQVKGAGDEARAVAAEGLPRRKLKQHPYVRIARSTTRDEAARSFRETGRKLGSYPYEKEPKPFSERPLWQREAVAGALRGALVGSGVAAVSSLRQRSDPKYKARVERNNARTKAWIKDRTGFGKAVPRRLLAAGAAAATGAAGATYGPTVMAEHHADQLSDPRRAKRLARNLAEAGAASTARGQKEVYARVKDANPDVKHLRPAVDRWSRTMRGVSRIKAAEGRRPGLGETVLHPVRARAEHDRRALDSVLEQAPTNDRVLYRGVFVPKRHKVAVRPDTPTSWAVGREAPERMISLHERKGRFEDRTPVVVKKPRGTVHSLNIAAATPNARYGSMREQITRTKARADTDVAKKDDRFLSRYRDRISPQAEVGYQYLRTGRNQHREQAAGNAVMAGLTGALTAHEVKSRNKLSAVVTAASTLASGMSARNAAREARGWDAKMVKIKAKARSREAAGLYAPGRGKTPTDSTSRARNLAAATGARS